MNSKFPLLFQFTQLYINYTYLLQRSLVHHSYNSPSIHPDAQVMRFKFKCYSSVDGCYGNYAEQSILYVNTFMSVSFRSMNLYTVLQFRFFLCMPLVRTFCMVTDSLDPLMPPQRHLCGCYFNNVFRSVVFSLVAFSSIIAHTSHSGNGATTVYSR